jgi:hypothetical protein
MVQKVQLAPNASGRPGGSDGAFRNLLPEFAPGRAAHPENRFQNSPPYHFPNPAGEATGPAVELVRAAAQRTGIHIEWVFSPQGPGKALSTGAVDLWPLLWFFRIRPV